jgi:tRNA A-37 threonylcarbamoyl transferase component Bud32
VLLALIPAALGLAEPMPDITAREKCTQAERELANGQCFDARRTVCQVLLAGDRPDWTQAHVLLVRSYVDDTGPSRLTSEKTAAFQGDRAFGGYNVQCIPGAAPGWFFGRGLCNLELAKVEKFYTEAAVKDFKAVYAAYESKATRAQVPQNMLDKVAELRGKNPDLAAKLPEPPGPGMVSGALGWAVGHWMIVGGVLGLIVLFLIRRPILRAVTTGTGKIRASFVMRKCPHCSELAPKSAETCPKCHWPLHAPKPGTTPAVATPPTPAAGDPTAVVRCPNCGMKNTRETLICTGCKFTLARTCTRCKQPVEYHKLKCPSCGHETELAKYAKTDYNLTTIGAGGVSEVQRAEHRSTGDVYAFKTLKERFREDEIALNTFEHGAAVLMSLGAPGIVEVLAFVKNGELPYYVMPYLTGATLEEYMTKQGRMPWPDAALICIDIANAAEFLHHRGIVHRDLKPSNLKRDKADGRFCIIDFDTALDPDAKSTKVGTGATAYTLDYAPPEQLNGDDLDCRVDIFALGTILYEMIVGSTGMKWTQRLAAYETPGSIPVPKVPVGTGLGSTTEEIAEIIAKAMAIQPRDRFPDMETFREALTKASLVRTLGGTGAV